MAMQATLIQLGLRPLISSIAPAAIPDQTRQTRGQATARALVLEPRCAVLRALRVWAADCGVGSRDLAVLDRVFTILAATEDGPDLDLAMRTARRRVINQARQQSGGPVSS